MKPEAYDVVVVGSGAAGMTAALAASSLRASTVVLEKGERYGGSSALSGGQLWIPNNSLQHASGIEDSGDKAITYLLRTAGGRADRALIGAFVDNAPKALDFLLGHTPIRPTLRAEEPDYHPEWEGALEGGRTLDPGLFDGSLLGRAYSGLLHNPQYHLAGGHHVTSVEFERLMRGEEVKGLRTRRRSTVALGEALVCALRKGLADKDVHVRLSHRVRRLVKEEGRVSGVEVILPGGRRRTFLARKAVVMAAGGFEWNLRMKKRFLRAVSENSAGCESNTGDGIRMGIRAGALTSLMDEAWWFTLIRRPGERRGWLVTSERTFPGSVMVNEGGRRFVNEAMNYLDVAKVMMDKSQGSRNLPSYLVFDSAYASKYSFVGRPPGARIPWWVESAPTLMALGSKLRISPRQLASTVKGFNRNARLGSDPDFHRGRSPYDGHWGDPKAKNPTLGPVEMPPFYGVRILAGDIGTMGGLKTDGSAGVLDRSGGPVPGLFAAGNNSSSVMGGGYAGSGATLGLAITFGYLAGISAAKGE